MTARGIAVIIPTYNRAELVQRALRSALEQPGVDLEVIVVDDGSTDDTPSVLGTVDDERFTLIVQNNSGRCAARNAGAEIASKEWLVFLDSDDELIPASLSAMAELAVESRRLVVAQNRKIAPDGRVRLGKQLWDPHESLPNGFQAGAFAIHRTLFERIGGYCEQIHHSEHTEMAYRIRSIEPRPDAARLPSPTVLIREREQAYDANLNYETANHLLEHLASEFKLDPAARADYLRIAGVAAGRLGKRREACWRLGQSLMARPRLRTVGHLVRAPFSRRS
jgi:glycosyltransferase involved in cell wall biosynthesis